MYLNPKVLLVCSLLLLLVGGVSAYSGSVLKDYYFDINQNEVVYLYPYLENYSAYCLSCDTAYLMNNDTIKYSITFSNNDTGDVSLTIGLFDGELEQYNASDYLSNGYDTITNNSLYYFVDVFGSNKTAGEFGDYSVCGYFSLAPSSKSANIRFFSGYNKSGVYVLDYSHNININSLTYTTYCGDFSEIYDDNITAGDVEVFGFECLDCGSSPIRIGIDNTFVYNTSKISPDNNISNEYNYTYNFMLYANEFEREPGTDIYFFDDVMRWREPIYINYTLYREYKDDTESLVRELYGDDNFFLYAVPEDDWDSYIPDGVVTATMNSLPTFGVDFDMLDFGSYDNNFIFTWDRLDSGVAEMKFYEVANYSLYLRNIKFLDESKLIDEFSKPLYDDTDIDYYLTDVEVNQSGEFNVYFSDLEVRKFELYRNALFYGAGFLLWLFAVIILLNMGLDFKVFAGTALSALLLIMGAIGAIL